MLKLQFINLSHPSDAASAESQRKAHSHAAATAHARARRLRIIEHQQDQSKNQQRKVKRSLHDDEKGKDIKGNETEASKQAVAQALFKVNPKTLLSASRADPFVSFEKALNHREQFLLDHCQ
jgi:hypothetical protein